MNTAQKYQPISLTKTSLQHEPELLAEALSEDHVLLWEALGPDGITYPFDTNRYSRPDGVRKAIRESMANHDENVGYFITLCIKHIAEEKRGSVEYIKACSVLGEVIFDQVIHYADQARGIE